MAKYRKKPVVIEAVQWHGKGSDLAEWPEWFRDAVEHQKIVGRTDGSLDIWTSEGIMLARIGYWIIRGVQGELYPCKPDIFAATYEPA